MCRHRCYAQYKFALVSESCNIASEKSGSSLFSSPILTLGSQASDHTGASRDGGAGPFTHEILQAAPRYVIPSHFSQSGKSTYNS